MSMKNANDTSWGRTSDLPICSTALKVKVENEIQVAVSCSREGAKLRK